MFAPMRPRPIMPSCIEVLDHGITKITKSTKNFWPSGSRKVRSCPSCPSCLKLLIDARDAGFDHWEPLEDLRIVAGDDELRRRGDGRHACLRGEIRGRVQRLRDR